MTQHDPFARAAPPISSGDVSNQPANHQLVGRLCIFWVVGFNQGVESAFDDPANPGQKAKQNQIIAHTAVLDGAPFTGKVDWHTRQETPFPFPLSVPIEFEGMLWSQKVLIGQLQPHLNTGKPVLGRLYYGEKRGNYSPPIKLNENPTQADIELGMRYLQQRDQIKATWSQRFAQVATPSQPPQPGPGGWAQNPAIPGGWNQPQPAYGTPPTQPQYPQPAPVQDQPWNPYNGQQQPASYSPIQAQATGNGWSNQNGPDTGQPTPAWQPEPQGPPPGWPGSNQQ
jgi:hypothetical protein